MRARLRSRRQEVAVGRPFLVSVEVNNDGDQIASARVEVPMLPDTAWRVDPLSVALFPGESQLIEVEVTLPADTPAGEQLLPIRVVSEDYQLVLDASIEVAPVDRISVTLSPKVVLGRSKAVVVATVTNRGNRPTGVSASASDLDRKLRYAITPASTQLAAGEATAFQVVAKGRRPLSGNPLPRVIRVDVESRSERFDDTVTFTQKPILSRGLITAVVLIGIVALWVAVFTAGFRTVVEGQRSGKSVAASFDEGAPPDPAFAAGGITGRVVAASDQRPLARIVVSAEPVNVSVPPVAGSTDADGVYALTGLAPGRYRIVVSGSGYRALTLPDEVRVVPGAPVELPDAELGGLGASITGTVAGGNPPPTVVVEARLMVDDTPSQTAVQVSSDADGRYVLEGLASPAVYRLTFLAEGFEPLQISQEVAAGEAVVLPVAQLSAGGGSISGRVADQDGAALGGVEVAVSAGGEEVTTVTPTTGAEIGRFVLGDLASPATYLLRVTADGFGTETITVRIGPGEDLVLEAPIVLFRGTGSVSGRVLDTSGRPVGGVVIEARDGVLVAQTTSVDATGGFLLTGLPVPGSYVLRFIAEGYRTETLAVELVAGVGSREVDVTLTGADASIVGRVEREGTALSGVDVTASAGSLSVSTVSTDPNGRFRLDGLAPGFWTITVTPPDRSPTVLLVSVSAGANDVGAVEVGP